jgi:hypothetical protein
MSDDAPKTPFPATDDLVFCGGCLCCFEALYTDMPDCIGCVGVAEILCCTEKFCCSVAGMKNPYPVGMSKEKKDGEICELGLYCCSCALQKPRVCCESKVQECCIVGAGALPCTEDVPSVFGMCFVSCYPNGFKVFKPMKEITGKAAGAPETDMEMTRA